MTKRYPLLLVLFYFFSNIAFAQEGTWDNSFNGIGANFLPDAGSGTPFSNQFPSGFEGVAVQPDGKIVVGGSSQVRQESTNYWGIPIFRYNQDGTHDSTFKGLAPYWPPGLAPDWDTLFSGSAFLRNFNSDIRNILIQSDGKIIIAGISNALIAVGRLLPNGYVDSTFAGGGIYNEPGLWNQKINPDVISLYGEIIEGINFTPDSSSLIISTNTMRPLLQVFMTII